MRGSFRFVAGLCLLVLVGCTAQQNKPSNGDIATYEVYSRLGFEYLQEGDTSNAKNSFQRAVEMNSGYAEAHNGLALVFQLEGDLELAENYYRKATKLAPDSAMMHNNFGAFLFSQQRYDEACRELARATEDPFYNRRSQAFENLGRCYRLIDQGDAAKHAFQRALQVTPNRPVSMVELADLLVDEGDGLAAAKYFDRFLELVEKRQVEHYARSLWVGIKLERLRGNATRAATYALILKSLFPESEEYQLYEESAR